MKNSFYYLVTFFFFPLLLTAQSLQQYSTKGFQAMSTTVQSDGKILVAGQVDNIGGYDILLLRYLPDGNLDLNFGTNGQAELDIDGQQDMVADIELQADGKIVLLGQSSAYPTSTLILARFNAAGRLDESFGNAGLVQYLGKGNSMGKALSIQTDGKILVAGLQKVAGYDNTLLLRYEANGNADLSFGDAGVARYAATQYDDQVNDLLVQADASIWVLGGKQILRFSAAGALDRDFPKHQGGTAMQQAANGHTLVAASAYIDHKLHFSLMAYRPDGSIDKAFGKEGSTIHAISGEADARVSSLCLLPDGKIVLAGQVENNNNETSQLTLLRLSANGKTDELFGQKGILAASPSEGSTVLHDLAVHPNGSLVLIGATPDHSNEDQAFFALLKLAQKEEVR